VLFASVSAVSRKSQDRSGATPKAGKSRGRGEAAAGASYSAIAETLEARRLLAAAINLITAHGNSTTNHGPLSDLISRALATLTGGAGETNANSSLASLLNARYGSSATWLPLIQSVFTEWSNISGVTYIYEPNDDGAAMSTGNSGVLGVRGDVRIGAHPIDGA